MNMSRNKLFFAGGVLLALLIAVLVKQSMTFHLTGTVPGDGSQPNQYTEITFKFNHSLASSKESVNQINIVPTVAGRSSIKGGQITFIPVAAYDTNTKYTATLSGILSAKGEKLSDISIAFS